MKRLILGFAALLSLIPFVSTAQTAVVPGITIEQNGTLVTATIARRDCDSFLLDFGDGYKIGPTYGPADAPHPSTCTSSIYTLPIPHTFAPGTYTISYKTYNNAGTFTFSKNTTVTIAAPQPPASATPTATTTAATTTLPSSVNITMSGMTATAVITRRTCDAFKITFGDGYDIGPTYGPADAPYSSICTSETYSLPIPHTYATAGNYTIRYTTYTNTGVINFDKSQTVTASANQTPANTPVDTSTTVTGTPSQVSSVSYAWNDLTVTATMKRRDCEAFYLVWGDGTPAVGPTYGSADLPHTNTCSNTTYTQKISHTYPGFGAYQLTYKTLQPDGNTTYATSTKAIIYWYNSGQATTTAYFNEPSTYILPYINPGAPLPAFVNFGAGTWETDTYPDTFDIMKHALLSINALTGPLLKEADYELYWFGEINANPPRLDMGMWERLVPQFMANLQWMRYITGDTTSLDVDKVWQNRLIKSLSPGGSLAFSLYKNYIPAAYDIMDYRALGAQFVHDVYAQDWALYTISNLYRLTKDSSWKTKGMALVDDVTAKAAQCYTGTYGPYCSINAPAYTTTYKGGPDPILGAPATELGGRMFLGLSNFYAATGYTPAKDLAQKFANYLVNYSGYFDRTSGAFLVDPKQVDEVAYAHGTHFGRHSQALVGLTDYAVLTGDDAVLRFVQNSYNWAKNAPCSNNPAQICTNTTVGWFPEFLDSNWPKSDYAVADMIQVGVKLSAAGKGNYWDETERWIRNQFSAQQLQDVSWIPAYSKKFANLDTQNASHCGGNTSAVLCTVDNVAQRLLGSWGGFVRPNEYLMDVPSTGGHGVMEDSTGWGPMALYTIWKHQITRGPDYFKVNLLFNRNSEWANVYSYIPYTGRVDVKIKDATIPRVFVRVPEWTDATKVTVYKNNTAVPSVMSENYAVANGPFVAGDVISVRFPINTATKSFTFPASKYGSTERVNMTFSIKGDTVVSVTPGGTNGAFYTDRSKYLGAVQTKSVSSFVPGVKSFANDYPTPPSPNAPTLHIYANGSEGTLYVTRGSGVGISWNAGNIPERCAVYGPSAAPIGLYHTSGNQTNLFNGSGTAVVPAPGQGYGPVNATSTFTLLCQPTAGSSYLQSSVTVIPR